MKRRAVHVLVSGKPARHLAGAEAQTGRMTVTRIYLAWMALTGAGFGLALAARPALQDAGLPPYFWVLIAAALFDGVLYLRRRSAPAALLPMPARLIGFALGMALMVAVPFIAGAPVRFL